ncbi:MAG: hypothetical protein K2M79_01995 [Muribaculaceae bacterium]|nr:hypothetical protein [Muribaculaceae bacterium]
MAQLHPEFVKAMAGLPDVLRALTETEPVVSVRMNVRKPMPSVVNTPGECKTEQVAVLTETGRYLDVRPRFSADPAWHVGAYYVQDASSMVITPVVRELVARLQAEGAQGITYMDACAAPGGKTTAALDALPPDSVMVANEYDFKRASVLRENLLKWGCPDVIVTRGGTERFSGMREVFDIIAVDAPCSGEGMMRKDSEAVAQWTPALVCECAQRQREILDNLWPALKPGGYLVYSTCTFNHSENEDIIKYLEQEYEAVRVETVLDTLPGVTEGHFYPGRFRGEGLYMAVVSKPGEWKPDSIRNKSEKSRKQTKKKADAVSLPEQLRKSLPEGYRFIITDDGCVQAMSARVEEWMKRHSAAVDVISAGVEVATVKGRDVIPSHALAMCTVFDSAGWPQVEVNKACALSYLRREAIELPEGTPGGMVLICYGSQPLGWVKNLGKRANNLYPLQYRLRT